MSPRSTGAIIDSVTTLEGAGMVVHRAFPGSGLDQLDPFLLLDHMGPADLTPAQAVGFPDHPHRGFETVTYILEGHFEHRDSEGHVGMIGPGDVQWMTAGSGLVHSEMPGEGIRRDGGRLDGFQLWVNLPAADKMKAPRYQDVTADMIPMAEADGGRVRVISGEARGVVGPARTHTPVLVAHATVDPGGSVDVETPAGSNAAALVFDGQGTAGSDRRRVRPGQLVVFPRGDGEIHLSVPDDAEVRLEALVLAGVPLGEPVARYGPFVMNTRDELAQAVDDYNAGRFGTIAAP